MLVAYVEKLICMWNKLPGCASNQILADVRLQTKLSIAGFEPSPSLLGFMLCKPVQTTSPAGTWRDYGWLMSISLMKLLTLTYWDFPLTHVWKIHFHTESDTGKRKMQQADEWIKNNEKMYYTVSILPISDTLAFSSFSTGLISWRCNVNRNEIFWFVWFIQSKQLGFRICFVSGQQYGSR